MKKYFLVVELWTSWKMSSSARRITPLERNLKRRLEQDREVNSGFGVEERLEGELRTEDR